MTETLAQKNKQTHVTEIDLTQIQGDGDFLCPTCGATISPEDESEQVYIIIEEKVVNDTLEEMIIQCNKCSNQIRLIGFSILEMEPSNQEQ